MKVLKLHPERKITLLSLGFKKKLDVKKPEDSKMIITMLAADTREYSTERLIRAMSWSYRRMAQYQ
jgi:hypothetical protein